MNIERLNKIRIIFEQNKPIVKTAILRENKINSRDIMELIESGYIKKVKTGYYAWADDFENYNDLEVVQGIIPEGVISVFSAAEIHELTTVNSTCISVTIPTKMLKPKLPDYPPIELYYISNKYLKLGIINYETEHMNIRLYNPERTVCDFFKYSDNVGNDVALEVIKNYMSRKNKNIQMLFEYATKLRVKKYIKPYVEALL
jgi:predicted transcriptional regulator of viral defense system